MPKLVVISAQVESFVRALAPEPRRRVRRSLETLAKGQGDIRTLEEELEGYHRLRIGRYRVIFRYSDDGAILCVFIETRALVYQLFASVRDLLEEL
jgi:mRNA interferase RelE/StbE